MKTLVVLFFAVMCQCLGDVFLTKGMKSVGEINTFDLFELFQIGVQVFSTPMIWMAIGILAAYFFLNLAALSWADLTYVVPLSAFGYVVNALLAKYLLFEEVSLSRWIGTIIICVGVAMVSRTEQNTTRTAGEAGQ